MKIINVVSLFLISIISITTWANSDNEPISLKKIAQKNTLSDLNSAPFGFRWGDDLDEVKSKLAEPYEIINDPKRCPFVVVKANNLDETIKNTGEYELLIMPKYNSFTFNGLLAISYKSQPANMKAYHNLLGKIINSLKRNYGVLKQARSMNGMERYYSFEGDNFVISLTGEQYKDSFYIDLEYAFIGYEYNQDTELGYSIAMEECKKQRSQH